MDPVNGQKEYLSPRFLQSPISVGQVDPAATYALNRELMFANALIKPGLNYKNNEKGDVVSAILYWRNQVKVNSPLPPQAQRGLTTQPVV